MGPLAEWGASARPWAPNTQGNTPWAHEYAQEIVNLWGRHAARRPRDLQVHLGPSELGVECDRQVVGKMAGAPVTNHVTDPWPSIRGTALHEWASRVFEWVNEVDGFRFLAEHRVRPLDMHPGTTDLYDALWECCADHKFLGENSMAKVRSASGPPRKYKIQMKFYAKGLRRLGLPVNRIALLAYPATKGSLSGPKGLYVWHEEYDEAADEAELAEVERQTEYRRQWALAVMSGTADLMDVPSHEDEHECYFCPLYRPQAAKDGGIGCPGHSPSL